VAPIDESVDEAEAAIDEAIGEAIESGSGGCFLNTIGN